MHPTTPALPSKSLDEGIDTRRVSTEPADGYVLEPWSGLYLETELAFQSRVAAEGSQA